MSNLNEANLLDAMRDGDQTAFDALFRAYYAPLCYYAASLNDGDRDEAEDLVQQAFIKLWEQRETLQINWSVKAYLYRTVHNASLNRLRAAKVRNKYKQYNAEQLEMNHYPAPEPEPELRERLQKALADLPTQCRQVFELSRFEDLKYREIAEHLNISIKTVETHMGKALRLLKTQLADYLVVWLVMAWWQGLQGYMVAGLQGCGNYWW